MVKLFITELCTLGLCLITGTIYSMTCKSIRVHHRQRKNQTSNFGNVQNLTFAFFFDVAYT